jgi:hypothetical protein
MQPCPSVYFVYVKWKYFSVFEVYRIGPHFSIRSKSRRTRWVEYVTRMGNRRGAYRVLVGRPQGKRTFGRLRRRWENSIKVELQEVGWGGMDYTDLAQDRDSRGALLKVLKNLWFP